MKTMKKKIAIATMASLFASTPLYAAESAPAFIKRISDSMISSLKKNGSKIKTNKALQVQIVRQNLEPHVDFNGFASGVMGQYYRQATPVQRNQFIVNFKNSLINTYSSGLGEYSNQTYTIRPFKSSSSSKASVSVDVKSNGKNIPVTYQMVKKGSAWKVRNVVVNGVDIGLTFRSQFASTVRANKGNLDAAIRSFKPKAPVK